MTPTPKPGFGGYGDGSGWGDSVGTTTMFGVGVPVSAWTALLVLLIVGFLGFGYQRLQRAR